jgi:hypothetical protein
MILGKALFRLLGEIVSGGTGCSMGCSELDLESAGDGLDRCQLNFFNSYACNGDSLRA